MQFRRHRAGRAGLLAVEAEIANFDGMCRIAEVVNLGHAGRPASPARRRPESDAGIAFPPALVGVGVIAADAGDEDGMCRIGDVPNFMRRGAEGAQQIHGARIAVGQVLAVAHARHLRAATLRAAFGAGNMCEILRLRRIGHVDDRGAVELGLTGQRIDRLGHIARAVMADISDVAVALPVDGRLIGAAGLQVVVADQPHVPGLRRIADLGRLRTAGRHRKAATRKRRGRRAAPMARPAVSSFPPRRSGLSVHPPGRSTVLPRLRAKRSQTAAIPRPPSPRRSIRGCASRYSARSTM